MAILEKVRKSEGIKTYYIDFRDQHGRRVRAVAGTTRTQARKLLQRRLGEVRAGTYVNPRDRKKDEGPTLNEFADRFLKEYAVKCRSDHYTDRLKRIRAFFGDRLLQNLKRADLDRFHVERLGEASGSTVRKDLAVLVTLFKKAVEWGVLEASPAVGLRKPPEPKPRTRYLAHEEWQRLEKVAPPWLRPILTLTVATGMRLKEVVSLRWQDVDYKVNVLHVAEDTKTGTRGIPLNATALRVLREREPHRFRSPYVFTNSEGQPYTSDKARNEISKATKSAMKGAGIEGASFHTLRHTSASFMVQAGVPLYEVQKVLGHSTSLMTERYAHLQPGHLRGAVGALDRALGGVDTYMDTRASAGPGAQNPAPANLLKQQ